MIRKLYLAVADLGLLCGFVGYFADNNWDIAKLPGVFLSALHLFFPRPGIVADDSAHILPRSGAVLCGISGFAAAGLLCMAAANRTVSDL